MDNTLSDQRKYRCLVALLSKNKIFSIEEAVAKKQLFPGISLELAAKAVEEAKIRSAPKWEKRIKKLLVDGQWSPAMSEWVEFDEMRKQIHICKLIAYDRACFVWSPVELWVCIKAQSPERIIHIRSNLTDETYYGHYQNHTWRVLDSRSDHQLMAHRSPYTGSISSSTINRIINTSQKNGVVANDLLKKVLNTANFS